MGHPSPSMLALYSISSVGPVQGSLIQEKVHHEGIHLTACFGMCSWDDLVASCLCPDDILHLDLVEMGEEVISFNRQ